MPDSLPLQRLSMMNQEQYLDLIEKVHRERVGKRFCYCATEDGLSVVEEGEAGHFPLSEDHFSFEDPDAASRAADLLNEMRLGLSPGKAALIVASSLSLRVNE